MRKKQDSYHDRQFLNDHYGAAMYELNVRNSSWTNTPRKEKKARRYLNIDASLHITDCSGSIDLEFHINRRKELKRKLKKIDRLEQALKALRAKLVEYTEKEVAKGAK